MKSERVVRVTHTRNFRSELPNVTDCFRHHHHIFRDRILCTVSFIISDISYELEVFEGVGIIFNEEPNMPGFGLIFDLFRSPFYQYYAILSVRSSVYATLFREKECALQWNISLAAITRGPNGLPSYPRVRQNGKGVKNTEAK